MSCAPNQVNTSSRNMSVPFNLLPKKAWRRPRRSAKLADASFGSLVPFQGIEDQTAQKLRIKIGGFGRHLLEVAGNLLDMLHSGRRHQDRELALPACDGLVDFQQQTDVPAHSLRRRTAQQPAQ